MPLLNSMGILRSMITSAVTTLYTNYFNSISFGGLNQISTSGVFTSTGGTFVVGTVPGLINGDDGFVLKTDSYGNITKQIIVRSPQTQNQYSLTLFEPKVDSQNNLYVAGRYSIFGPGSAYRCFIAKFDNNLNLIWQKVLYNSGTTNAFFDAIINESLNTIYAVGYTEVSTTANSIVAGYDMTTGNLIFQNTVGSNALLASGIVLDNASNYYITSATRSTTNRGVEIHKFNSSNVFQWAVRLNTAANSLDIPKIGIDSNNNIYVGFIIGSTAYVAKFNSSGALQWQKSVSGSYSRFVGLAVDPSGNTYINIFSDSTNYVYILKLSTTGTITWQNYLNDYNGLFTTSVGAYMDGIEWRGNKLWIGCLSSLFSPTLGYNWVLPDDGTLTGSYTGFSYLPSSLTVSNSSLTTTSLVNTSTSLSLIDAAGAATILTGTATQVLVPL